MCHRTHIIHPLAACSQPEPGNPDGLPRPSPAEHPPGTVRTVALWQSEMPDTPAGENDFDPAADPGPPPVGAFVAGPPDGPRQVVRWLDQLRDHHELAA